MGIGFLGVILMLTPQFGVVDATIANENRALGATFAIFAALCTAGATIQVRRLTATERTGAIVFYFSLFSTVIGLATIVLGWTMPSLTDFGILVVIGILGGIGQILLTQSYRFGDASLIAPFEYTTMIWALLLGWFVFGGLAAGDRARRRRHRHRSRHLRDLARTPPWPGAPQGSGDGLEAGDLICLDESIWCPLRPGTRPGSACITGALSLLSPLCIDRGRW